ncbi:MAG: hypothetical protein ABI948_11370, partial [Thermoleophilia bacterium]
MREWPRERGVLPHRRRTGTPADVGISSRSARARRSAKLLTLTITATNGKTAATDAFIKDVMPAGFQYVACSLKIGGVEGGFCSWDGVNTVVGDIGKFAADRAVVELAAAGDAVARRLIERLAEEIVLMATRALADLGLAERQATLLLGGGMLRDGQGFLYEQTLSRLADRAPHAVPVPVTAAPVLG